MSDELSQLEAEAAAVDLANTPVNPAEQAQAQAEQEQAAQAVQDAATQEAEIVGILTIMRAVVEPMYPRVAAVYTDSVIQNIAQTAVPVMIKRGWSAGSLLGKYGEEFALLAVIAPVLFATYMAVLKDNEEAERLKAEEEAKGQADKAIEPAAGHVVVIKEPQEQDFQPLVMPRG